MTVQLIIFEENLFNRPPNGFQLREDGIWHKVSSNGKTQWVWLCSHLRVLSMPRDRDGKGWSRHVEVRDPDGHLHRLVIPARMFASDGVELRAQLLDLGLSLAPDKRSRDALMALLTGWRPAARAITTDRLGWTDENCTAFVLGDGRVIGGGGMGDDDVVYQHDNTPTAVAEMKPSGTLEGWRENVAAPCAGNALMVAAVSLGFAGPLLEPLGLDGGGIHLRG